MRTPQQAMKDAIESGAVQAWIDGRLIEYTSDPTSHWTKFSGSEPPHFNTPIWHWRPAPEPKLRPWKPEDVPHLARIRRTAWPLGIYSTITGIGIGGIEYSSGSGGGAVHFDIAAKEFAHSTDGGKTWALCGVLEGGE